MTPNTPAPPLDAKPVPRVFQRFWRYLDYAAHVVALNTLGRLARPSEPMGIRLIRNYPYIEDGSRSHLLDVWMPPPFQGPSPVIFYIHGGGFTFGSKDTHQIAGRMFAQRGYLTFMINYRLAPQHPYPASIEDVCHAFCWVHDHLEHFGGDPNRIVIAGESAGGNLTAMLAMINSYQRPELFCQEVWSRNINVRAAIPFCGWHEPNRPGKYQKSDHPILKRATPVLIGFLSSIIGRNWRETRENAPLLSPLPFLEHEPDRPIPPFLIPIGTNDPLLSDSRKLKKALDGRGVRAAIKEHRNAIHAHHLFPSTPGFKQCWRDVSDFLKEPGILGTKLHAVA